jgi:hypothetical protein
MRRTSYRRYLPASYKGSVHSYDEEHSLLDPYPPESEDDAFDRPEYWIAKYGPPKKSRRNHLDHYSPDQQKHIVDHGLALFDRNVEKAGYLREDVIIKHHRQEVYRAMDSGKFSSYKSVIEKIEQLTDGENQ